VDLNSIPTTLYVVCAVVILGLFLLVGVCAWLHFSKPSTLPTLSAPERSEQPTVSIDETNVIQALSHRLAVLEGQLPNLQVTIDNFGALAARTTALESQLPSIADAHEAFVDSMDRKAKRDNARDVRAGKTAGDAAAEQLAGMAPPPMQANGAAGTASPAGASPAMMVGRGSKSRGRGRGRR